MFIPEIPENSLTAEITEIVGLCRKLENDYEFNFAPPVTESKISKWEQNHDICLPEQVMEWLGFTNGCTIAYDRIFPLERFIVGHEQLPNDLVIIGVTHDESMCFSRNSGEIVRYSLRETRRYNDFRDFLNSTLIRSLKKG